MIARKLLPLVFLSPLCVPGPVMGAEWSKYRGPEGDGSTPEVIAWRKEGLRTVWKVETSGGFSSLVVGGGRAFTQVLREVDGAAQETLLALDAATGKELWAAALSPVRYDPGGDSGTSDNAGGDGPRSTPCVAGNLVIVTSSLLKVSAFEVGSGKLVWERDLGAEHAGRNIGWQNAASPLLEGGVLYVAGGGPGESVLALNPANGEVLWKTFDEKITHATPVAATILGQRQVIFYLQSGLLSVEPRTGRELWRYAFPYKVSSAASPVVGGDIVYCSAGYGVGAGAVRISKEGDAFKASEIYRFPGNQLLANHWSTPVQKNGFLYGMFQFKEYGKGPLKCVELSTGEVKWSKEGFGPGHVVLVGGDVVALSDAGELVRIAADPSGYRELSRQKAVEGKCWTTPAVTGSRIYVRSTKEAACLE